ncbi:MAG: hypothetical protein R3F31_14190 [Verrucomicrobiales bacterium]
MQPLGGIVPESLVTQVENEIALRFGGHGILKEAVMVIEKSELVTFQAGQGIF